MALGVFGPGVFAFGDSQNPFGGVLNIAVLVTIDHDLAAFSLPAQNLVGNLARLCALKIVAYKLLQGLSIEQALAGILDLGVDRELAKYGFGVALSPSLGQGAVALFNPGRQLLRPDRSGG